VNKKETRLLYEQSLFISYGLLHYQRV